MNKKQIETNFEIGDSSSKIIDSDIALILLAAGASRRMGNEPKQLLEFGGETLIRRAARAALASACRPVCVVLGANYERLRPEIADLPVVVAANENWAGGMSSSLKTGLEKILEIAPGASAVCVTVADQPLVDFHVINRLINVFRNGTHPVAACRYAETVGVPAIFDRHLFGELMNLTGDAGAKKIISKYLSETRLINVPEAALDIDSPADYRHLTQFKEKKRQI